MLATGVSSIARGHGRAVWFVFSAQPRPYALLWLRWALRLSGSKHREGRECLNVWWGLRLELISCSHELCSRPSWVEQAPECARIPAFSHEPQPLPVQLKGNPSLLKVCWAHISAQEICRRPSVRPVPRESPTVRNRWGMWFPRPWTCL